MGRRPADGERAVQPLRELATPLVDLSGPMEYLEFQRSLDPFFPAGRRYYWKALYLDGLADDAIETTVGWSAPARTTPWSSSATAVGRSPASAPRRPLGDRGAGVDAEHRLTPHDPAADATNIAYTRAFWEGAARFSNGQTYFNFPGLLEEGDAAVRQLRRQATPGSRGSAGLRPREPLPPEPEHPARGLGGVGGLHHRLAESANWPMARRSP